MAEDDRRPGGARNPGEVAAPSTLNPREVAAQKRIAELRMRLLDLTNGNRLLNYKFTDRSRRQVRLVDELPDELIGRLEDGKRLAFIWGYVLDSSTYDRLGCRRLRRPRTSLTIAA